MPRAMAVSKTFNRRFTRKTMGFSRKLQNHADSIALFVAHFNFCHVHSALTVKHPETGVKTKQTPAMAQGIADHRMTMAEILTANP